MGDRGWETGGGRGLADVVTSGEDGAVEVAQVMWGRRWE